MAGLRAVVAGWANDEYLRQGPLPFRVAFIGVGAACCHVLGEYTPFGFALVSFAGGLLLLLASLLLARRWMRGTAGMVVAGLLCGVSPLAMGLSRRALQDSGFAALVILALWSLDCFLEKRRGRDALMLSVILFLGFMTKESMLFIYPLLLLLFFIKGGHRGSHGLGGLAAAVILPPLAALGVMVHVAGSFRVLYATYATYSHMQHIIPYALAYQRGPWFRYLVDFLLISPVVMLMAIPGVKAKNGFIEHDRYALCALLVTGVAVFSCLPLMNLRLVLFLDTPLRILAAGGIVALGCRWGKTPRQGVWIAGGLAAIVALLDLSQFYIIFIRAGSYDPVTAQLIKALGFMP
ncbi:MAG: glycosyltransferase family 39 protein [Lentisphaerae bacterium]|nr:glycosyltransferase family 39 protein [Lentisphaerota bacterium]